MLTNLQAVTIEHFGQGYEPHGQARRIAAQMFDRLQAQARQARMLARLFGRPNTLPTPAHRPVAAQRAPGIRLVPLARIVGSEGRSQDFDSAFRPLSAESRERWVSVAAARRAGIALPPVELIQDGNNYYVRDGHHRISVARAMGQGEIEARVVNG